MKSQIRYILDQENHQKFIPLKMQSTQNKTRTPTQKRSKERVEAILNAAKELIEEKGSSQLKIQELAKKANVTAGSIYQYFPDKSAIIHALFEQYLERVRSFFNTTQLQIHSLEELSEASYQLHMQYVNLYKTEPVLRDILAIAEADKRIQNQDIEDTEKNTNIIAELTKHLIPKERQEEFRRYIFMLIHTTNSVIQLSMYLEKKDSQEAEKMLEMYQSLFSVEAFKRFLE